MSKSTTKPTNKYNLRACPNEVKIIKKGTHKIKSNKRKTKERTSKNTAKIFIFYICHKFKARHKSDSWYKHTKNNKKG